jgi:hypothetical protein
MEDVMEGKHTEIKKHFKNGDWVFGTGSNKGCSEVFTGSGGDFQPFDYLNDYEPSNYRAATSEEIEKVKMQPWYS